MIGGWQVDDRAIGPTPGHWRGRPGSSSALPEEVYLVVLASVLGDVYAWSTVQNGRLVQDLVPVRGEDREKNANSSDSLLELHSEDAFSAYRCDYLGLMCLRNDDAVATTYASVEEVVLSPEQRRVLAEPRFVILPDPEHVKRAAERGGSSAVPDSPPRTGLLFGDLGSPYLVVDGLFVRTDPGDTEARDALDTLLGQLERNHHDVALRPGEVLFVDNYRAVHGRKPFRARYDGRDRWLKRVSVTRDLRKSRAARASAGSRVLE